MDIKTFKNVINDILVPYGYKKKGTNSWIRKGDEISMKVYLQKSSFSCRYYFHCYYVINNMPKELKGKNETWSNETWSNMNYSDYKLLFNMCDLENGIPDEERTKELQDILNKDFSRHKYIETEKDLKEMLIKRNLPILIVIQKYLGIDMSDGNRKKEE